MLRDGVWRCAEAQFFPKARAMLMQPRVAVAALASFEDWRAEVLARPLEDLERLAPDLSERVLRVRRIRERDAALERMKARNGDAGSVEAVAEAVHRELAVYRAGAWHRGDCDRAAPRSPDNADAHRVLMRNKGKVPSARTLRRLFAPPVAKTPGEMATARRHSR